MPNFFSSETSVATQVLDVAVVKAMDTHELLADSATERTQQIATFSQVEQIGSWFAGQSFNKVLSSNEQLPNQLLEGFLKSGNQTFLAKVILGRSPQDHYPATVEVIRVGQQLDIRIHLVPIAFSAFEVPAFSHGHDAVLPLLAASVVAPHMVLGLANGLEGGCSSTLKSTSLLKK